MNRSPQCCRRLFRALARGAGLPAGGPVTAALSLLGLVGLSYVAGAAAVYYDLPSSDYLEKGFRGARAWCRRAAPRAAPRSDDTADAVVVVDRAGKTCDGFTLITTNQGARARLIDMRGHVVHRWGLPFSAAWPRPAHVAEPPPDDQVHWFRCHLYPNGDLLAVYQADDRTPCGHGLVKLDRDSNLLWAYPAAAHHDVDVGDDGRIYTLTERLATEPPAELDDFPAPYIADSLVVLSPEGAELANVPLLEALRDSPYALALAPLRQAKRRDRPRPTGAGPRLSHPALLEKGDVLHANSVRVLRAAQAPQFPLFRAGQVLVSLRNLDTLVVVDVPTRSVVWAATGLWRGQHDAGFLDGGRLLVFDNLGAPDGARVLEYDPVTQAVPWAYAGETSAPFLAFLRGAAQRLPNGNTLFVDPDGRRLLEVTRDKELVWECACSPPAAPGPFASVTGARRYGADELTFLKGDPRVRP